SALLPVAHHPTLAMDSSESNLSAHHQARRAAAGTTRSRRENGESNTEAWPGALARGGLRLSGRSRRGGARAGKQHIRSVAAVIGALGNPLLKLPRALLSSS